jgi:hypothetical protein
MESILSSVPKNKDELLKSISVAFERILADYSTISVQISREIENKIVTTQSLKSPKKLIRGSKRIDLIDRFEALLCPYEW